MKTLNLLLLIFLSVILISCEEEETTEETSEPIEVNENSIIPSSTLGRPNIKLGCIEISSRITTIEVWDHGQIDGDIISIIANGDRIIDEQVLDGPGNPIVTDYDFGFNGFNEMTLFAHNLGDIAPNTCTVAINGVEFILEANLDANGSIDVVVSGYGVTCADANNGGSGGSGSGGGGTASDTGDAIFWTNQDYGCGPITVQVAGVGSSVITGYFDSGVPDCDNTSAGGNFDNLAPGNYTFTASCDGINWSGDFEIQENGCLRFKLTN